MCRSRGIFSLFFCNMYLIFLRKDVIINVAVYISIYKHEQVAEG